MTVTSNVGNRVFIGVLPTKIRKANEKINCAPTPEGFSIGVSANKLKKVIQAVRKF